MSPTRKRLRTQRELLACRAQFGVFHPATFAAYGRAFVAWDGRIKPPTFEDSVSFEVRTACCHAYTTAQIRAYRHDGYENRHVRRRYSLPIATVRENLADPQPIEAV